MAVSNFCKFHHFGHCKFGKQCTKQHMDRTCPIFKCQVEDCELRHPRLCRFFTQFGRCRFGNQCSYFHPVENKSDEEIKALKMEVETLIAKISEMENLVLRLNHLENEIETLRKPLHSPESILRRSKPSDDFPCEQCDYRASSKTVLKRHVTMKHKETSKPSLSLPPVPCFRNFYGCHNLVTEYKTENTAICPTCKKMLAEKEISNPFSPNLCPCCHESCSGPPFTFCGECLSGLKADNFIDSRWGAWQLETETGDIICIDLDFT